MVSLTEIISVYIILILLKMILMIAWNYMNRLDTVKKRLGLDCIVRSEGGSFSLSGLEPLTHDRVNGLMSGSRQYSWFGMHGRWKLFWFSPTGYSQKNSVVQLDSPAHLYLISPYSLSTFHPLIKTAKSPEMQQWGQHLPWSC